MANLLYLVLLTEKFCVSRGVSADWLACESWLFLESSRFSLEFNLRGMECLVYVRLIGLEMKVMVLYTQIFEEYYKAENNPTPEGEGEGESPKPEGEDDLLS